MSDLAHIIEQYVGENRKHAFLLKNGQEYFGWLSMEYDESGDKVDYAATYARFLWAPSPFDEPADEGSEEEVELEDIDLDSLCYWDYDLGSNFIKFTPDASRLQAYTSSKRIAEAWRPTPLLKEAGNLGPVIKTLPLLARGMAIHELSAEGQETSLWVFMHSRKKQVLALILSLVFVLIGVAMYFDAQNAEWPILGKVPAITRVFAVLTSLFFLGMAVFYVKTLLNPQTYIALLPEGILSSTTKPLLYIPWDNIEDVSPFGSGAQRATGIRLAKAESVASLQPFHSRMKSNRSFSGWDWGFSSKAFEAQPELVETAFQYFYFHPEKRAEIGTPQGFASVQEATILK